MKIITTPAEHQLIIDALKEMYDNTENYQHTECKQYGEEWYEAQMERNRIDALLIKLEEQTQ